MTIKIIELYSHINLCYFVFGQQITVKAATTIAGRFAETFGEKIATPFAELQRLCQTPECIAHLSIGDLAALGIIQSRARSIIALAQELTSHRLKLESDLHHETIIKQLANLPGIGKWTAHYIAMRALSWPDALYRAPEKAWQHYCCSSRNSLTSMAPMEKLCYPLFMAKIILFT